MKAWGVKLVDGKVVGDLDAAMRVNMSHRRRGRVVITDYVAWIQLCARATISIPTTPSPAICISSTSARAGALREGGGRHHHRHAADLHRAQVHAHRPG